MAKRILISKEDNRVLQFQDTDLFNYSDPRPDMEIVDENGKVIGVIPGHEVIEISEDDWNALVDVDEVDDEVQGMKIKRYVIKPKMDIKERKIILDKTTGAIYEELENDKKELLFELKEFKLKTDVKNT